MRDTNVYYYSFIDAKSNLAQNIIILRDLNRAYSGSYSYSQSGDDRAVWEITLDDAADFYGLIDELTAKFGPGEALETTAAQSSDQSGGAAASLIITMIFS